MTLIYYKRNNWRAEHPLNTLAAWATSSEFSHVEMAIGEECGSSGQMRNVLRVFNDSVGTELAERTGKNPNFVYMQLGCTKPAERAMLSFARQQVGKPFSMSGMFRSIIWPRKTRGDTYFCAGAPAISRHAPSTPAHILPSTSDPLPLLTELVAAALQIGGLLSNDSNPGAATPESLYRIYKETAACSGNPYILRRIAADRDAELGKFSNGTGLPFQGCEYAKVPEFASSTLMAPSAMHPTYDPPASRAALTGMFRMPVVKKSLEPAVAAYRLR